MRREFIHGFICGLIATTLLFGISFLIPKTPRENKTITHLQIAKEPLKKGIVEVFYPKENTAQEKLANRILEILVKECALIEKVLEMPQDKILAYQTYGLVFCEDVDDNFLKYTNQGLASVDGVLCYPVVNEIGFPFRDPKTRFRLVHSIPKEIVKSILKERLNLKNDAFWFAEGVGGYIAFLCWQELDKSAFFNYEYPRVLKLSSTFGKPQLVEDLSPNKFGLPMKKNPEQELIDLTEDKVFSEFSCYASIFIIIDLVKRYGRGIIAKTISKLEKSKNKIGSEEIAQTIKELTGQDIFLGLKAVSVKKVEERIKLLKANLLPQRK